MPQTSADWAEALAPGIRQWFSIGYQNRPSMLSQLFDVQSSESAEEFFHSYGTISPDAWADYENSGTIPVLGFDKGYKSTFTHSEFVADVVIQRKLYDDNKYPEIMNLARSLGDSAALQREKAAASVFNNCAVATVLGPDAVPLCDNSHPASPTKATVTQDNLDAVALSAAAVETIRQKMLAVTDDTNEISGIQPDLLLVNPALENTAKIITQTPNAIGVADNDINPQIGRFRYLIWPYLTNSTTWWAMIDSIKMKQSLKWFDRVGLSVYPKAGEDRTLFSTWRGYMRYSFGWTDWRWINRGNA